MPMQRHRNADYGEQGNAPAAQRAIVGYCGYIPAKRAENVFGARFSEANRNSLGEFDTARMKRSSSARAISMAPTDEALLPAAIRGDNYLNFSRQRAKHQKEEGTTWCHSMASLSSTQPSSELSSTKPFATHSSARSPVRRSEGRGVVPRRQESDFDDRSSAVSSSTMLSSGRASPNRKRGMLPGRKQPAAPFVSSERSPSPKSRIPGYGGHIPGRNAENVCGVAWTAAHGRLSIVSHGERPPVAPEARRGA